MNDPDEHKEYPARQGPSFVDLVSDLVSALTGLIRSEARLVRAEIVEAGQQVARGLELMAGGALFLVVALLVLVQAGVIALAMHVGPLWAAIIVGVGLALIGLILILVGRNRVRAARLVPQRTLEQTSRDIRLAKEQM